MDSLTVVTIKETIRQYLKASDLPKEVLRMIVKDVYEEVQGEAIKEIQEQLEKGDKDGK